MSVEKSPGSYGVHGPVTIVPRSRADQNFSNITQRNRKGRSTLCMFRVSCFIVVSTKSTKNVFVSFDFVNFTASFAKHYETVFTKKIFVKKLYTLFTKFNENVKTWNAKRETYIVWSDLYWVLRLTRNWIIWTVTWHLCKRFHFMIRIIILIVQNKFIRNVQRTCVEIVKTKYV
jgi:hypothetical protein